MNTTLIGLVCCTFYFNIMEIKQGDLIRFTHHAKSELINNRYYKDNNDSKDGWKKLNYMIVKSIHDSSYKISGYDEDNNIIPELEDNYPYKQDCELYIKYNIEEIMNNLDKLKNEYKSNI